MQCSNLVALTRHQTLRECLSFSILFTARLLPSASTAGQFSQLSPRFPARLLLYLLEIVMAAVMVSGSQKLVRDCSAACFACRFGSNSSIAQIGGFNFSPCWCTVSLSLCVLCVCFCSSRRNGPLDTVAALRCVCAAFLSEFIKLEHCGAVSLLAKSLTE